MRVNPRISQNIAKTLIWMAALFVLAVLGFILVYILIKGLLVINWQFLTEIPRNMGRSGGISSTIVGTLFVTAVAIVIVMPFGIGTAFYLSEYTRENALAAMENRKGCPKLSPYFL